MSWEITREYTALIGGILYKNVLDPICFNDKPIITLKRNTKTKQLGVSLKLQDSNNNLIAIMENNEIHSVAENFIVIEGVKRKCIIHKPDGRIFLDLKLAPSHSTHELELSALLLVKDGYPIILHPERTKIGVYNDNQSPNLSAFSITSDPNSDASGVKIENGSMYLLNMCFENLKTGLGVILKDDNELNR